LENSVQTETGIHEPTYLQITEIVVGSRFRKELGDIRGLAGSIKKVGLLHPIVVTEERILVAGVRRLEACKLLGWDKIPVHFVSLVQIEKGEVEENTIRLDFTASEIADIWEALAPKEQEEAQARREETQFVKGKKGLQGEGKLPAPKKGRVRKNIAQSINSQRVKKKAFLVGIRERPKPA